MRSRRTPVNRPLLAAAFFAVVTLPARADNPIAKELQNKSKTEPEFYHVQNEHAAMHQAVIKARKTVGQFIGALKHPADTTILITMAGTISTDMALALAISGADFTAPIAKPNGC